MARFRKPFLFLLLVIFVDIGYSAAIPYIYKLRETIARYRGRLYEDEKHFRVLSSKLVSSKNKILFIGDSFTEAPGIESNKTFVGRITDGLRAQNTEVLNASGAGFATIMYYRKIKYLIEKVGLKFDEVVVFVDSSDVSDEDCFAYDSTESTTYCQSAFKKWMEIPVRARHANLASAFVLHYTTGLSALYQKVDRWLFKEKEQYGLGRRGALWTSDPKLFALIGESGIKNAYRYMDLLYDLTAKHGIKMSIAVYPWPEHIVRRELDSLQVSTWKKWAAQHQVEFLNFFPLFINGKDPYAILHEYYKPYDVHWNEQGHALIAENYLKSRQMHK